MRSEPSPPESRPSPGPARGWGITVYAGRFGAFSWSTEDGFETEAPDPRATRWGVLGARRHEPRPEHHAQCASQRGTGWCDCQGMPVQIDRAEPSPVDDDDPVGGLEGSYRRQDVPPRETWTVVRLPGPVGSRGAPDAVARLAGPVSARSRRAQGVLDAERLRLVPNLSEPVSPEARGAVEMCQRMLTP